MPPRLPPSQAPRLCLSVTADEGAAERLTAALTGLAPACLYIGPPAGQALTVAAVRPLVELAQARGIAALIVGEAELARTLRADGVHLPPSLEPERDFAEAREIVGGRAIVGGDAGGSRHAAMTLGEAGAEYVAFSAAAGPEKLELAAWWGEIFEVPVVVLDVTSADEARRAIEAQVDFIGVTIEAVTAGTLTAIAREFDAAVSAAQ